MMHLYSALLCIAVHPKRFTIMWGIFTLLFSHLADAFIQSDLQIRKSNKNYKLKLYKYYIHTFKENWEIK